MKKTTKNLTLSAMFLAIGMVLPFFTGQIPQIGKMLLPMHIPVFLCGLICGWQYGLFSSFSVTPPWQILLLIIICPEFYSDTNIITYQE